MMKLDLSSSQMHKLGKRSREHLFEALKELSQNYILCPPGAAKKLVAYENRFLNMAHSLLNFCLDLFEQPIKICFH